MTTEKPQPTLFDQAVPRALEIARRELGHDVELTIVRDSVGYVTVVADGIIDPARGELCAAALQESLGAYSPGMQSVLLTREDLVDPDDVLHSPDRVALDEPAAFIVDRILTNQDWVRSPAETKLTVPVATAFSIKGGVGRTTALSVWAQHLAVKARKHVVVVDLDLEAPGLGATLLAETPSYGVVDWLAEDLVGQSDAIPIDDLVATSPASDGAEGSLRVVPAFGTKTGHYVSKLGRVLVPLVDPGGRPREIAARLRRLLTVLSEALQIDAILLDARAGLHDLGAAAVTQLGAKVFFFVRDELSAWNAWRLLFQQLRHSRMVQYGGPDDDLRWRLKMVGAQVGALQSDRDRLVDRSYDLWTALYDESSPKRIGGDPLAFPLGDRGAPHYPLTVLFDTAVRGLDLVRAEAKPDPRVLDVAFGEFCTGATATLFEPDEPTG